MNYSFYTLFILIFFVASCKNNESNKTDLPEIETGTPLEETENILIDSEQITEPNTNTTSTIVATSTKDYQEFYETGELKIEGDYDNDEERNGVWVSYYDNGTKWSESNYSHGLRSGHSITFYPNGNIRYVGEYKADKQFGKWTFYDEEGNLVKEESY